MEQMRLEGASGGHLVQPTCSKKHQLEQKAQRELSVMISLKIPYFSEARLTVSMRNLMPVVNGSAGACE